MLMMKFLFVFLISLSLVLLYKSLPSNIAIFELEAISISELEENKIGIVKFKVYLEEKKRHYKIMNCCE
jgi:hypothetical protein